MKIASPLTLNLTDTRTFKIWLHQIWQSVFFVAPHVHVSTISTKTLKNSKGTLKSICINIVGTGGSVCNVYDNTSATGTPIITIDTDENYGEKIYNIEFTTGLTIEITGSASPDLLFVFS